jgi:hypothetical protein
MSTLELYINATEGGNHTFIEERGTHRETLGFSSPSIESMLARAVAIIEGDASFEHRLRIVDAHGRMLKGDVARFIPLANLKVWLAPMRLHEPAFATA